MKKYTVLNWMCILITFIVLSTGSNAQTNPSHDTNETNGSTGGAILPVIDGNEGGESEDIGRKLGALLKKSASYKYYDNELLHITTYTYGYLKQGKAWLVSTLNIHSDSSDANLKYMTKKTPLLRTIEGISTTKFNGRTMVSHTTSVFTYEGNRLKSQKDYVDGKIMSDLSVLEWEGDIPVKTRIKLYKPGEGTINDIRINTITIKNNRVEKVEVQSSKSGAKTITHNYVNTNVSDPQYYTGYDPNNKGAIELHGLVQSLLIEKPEETKTQMYVYEFNPKGLVSKKTIPTKDAHIKRWTTYEYSYGNY